MAIGLFSATNLAPGQASVCVDKRLQLIVTNPASSVGCQPLSRRLQRHVARLLWSHWRATHDALRARRRSTSHVAYRRRPARRSVRPDGLVEEYLYPDPWATPPRSASLAQPSRLLCKASYMPRSSPGHLPVRGRFFSAYGAVICRHCSSAPNRPFSTAPSAV